MKLLDPSFLSFLTLFTISNDVSLHKCDTVQLIQSSDCLSQSALLLDNYFMAKISFLEPLVLTVSQIFCSNTFLLFISILSFLVNSLFNAINLNSRLGYCNSAINPVIYGLFSRQFRAAFKRILCKVTSNSWYPSPKSFFSYFREKIKCLQEEIIIHQRFEVIFR